MRWFVENSIGIVTALVPVLGYETATEIAKEALATGRGVYDLVCDRGAHDARGARSRARPASMLGLDQHAVPGATTEYSAVNDRVDARDWRSAGAIVTGGECRPHGLKWHIARSDAPPA